LPSTNPYGARDWQPGRPTAGVLFGRRSGTVSPPGTAANSLVKRHDRLLAPHAGWDAAACTMPPPELAPPGVQPADAAAARSAIAQAYASVDGGHPAGEPALLEDAARLQPTLDEAARRNNVPAQYAHVAWVVRDVVFTGPAVASVRYDITNDGQVLLGGRIGQAVLDHGVWKMARATMCEVLALGGTTCPGP
jgi:hypothetical protein